MKFILFCVACFFVLAGNAANISIRLEIKSGSIELIDGSNIPFKIFTSSDTFPNKSDLLIWETGDQITLKIVNNDTENHGFIINGIVDYGTILQGDSTEQTFTLLTDGIYRYFDPLNFPYNQYLGLSGMVHVKSPLDATPYFYWELREHLPTWNDQIMLGNSPVLSQYNPKYFTINGNSEPAINEDPIARVTGNVGNEFRIIVVNNGMSIHSMHFHGYHLFLEKNSKNADHQGREKDTFPLYPKEFVMLSCIPDKPGEYPVHDHNLVAVTGGGIYHAGMFTTLLITP